MRENKMEELRDILEYLYCDLGLTKGTIVKIVKDMVTSIFLKNKEINDAIMRE